MTYDADTIARMAKTRFVAALAESRWPEDGVAGVYGIYNVIGGRLYVGSAVNMLQRMKYHRKLLRADRHGNSRLQSAWLKYSEPCFRFIVLEHVPDKHDLIDREQHYIDALDASGVAGYNIRSHAKSNLGLKSSSETRARLSAAKRDKPQPNLRGRKQSPEAVARRRASLLARWAVTPKKPNPPISEVTRRKLSETSKGRTCLRGFVRSAEFKAKVSTGMTGKKRNEEFKRKCSESQKARFAGPRGAQLREMSIRNLPQNRKR